MENIDVPFAASLNNTTLPRWQRKALEASTSTSSSSCSTPQADRFIPNRALMNLDSCHFNLTHEDESEMEQMVCSPSKLEYQRAMKSNLPTDSSKILTFKQKAPAPKDGFQNAAQVLYTANKAAKTSKPAHRHIPQSADRILDAPEFKPDFYLNNLDWSAANVLSVALGDTVYLWNAETGSISELCKSNEGEYITSVSWIDDGGFLAVGTSDATVQIWDAQQQKRIRNMTGHDSRVAALCWNSHILTSGCKTGAIWNHDVRIQNHHVASMEGHTQEVCGLKWSPDGKSLASGGNDNLVNIWNANSTLAHTFTDHCAAVKALAWCPWQPNLLATGGGTADRHIRFWNTANGTCVNSIDTKSQVSAVMWSKEYRELISAHGFAQNQLTVWKYPTLTKVTELTGHTQRILSLAMSPDGSTVVSAAGDETLRFWKCFVSDGKQNKKKSDSQATSKISSIMIR